MSNEAGKLRLYGVDHTAFPTAKPKETIEFYRDVLGLPVLHAITAKGWGWAGGFPDFFHFFFDAGEGSTIAFFYHIDSPPPPRPENPRSYQAQARHTAWIVETDEEMAAWHAHLKRQGVKVTPQVRHELIESIYFLDPNDYPLEITRRLRELTSVDGHDAELSLTAIADTFGPNPSGETIQGRSIDDMWRRKGALVRQANGFDPEGRFAPAIYVLNVPEYQPLIDHARRGEMCVTSINQAYTCISARKELTLLRSDVALIEALWFSMLAGGLQGEIQSYDTGKLVIRASDTLQA